MTMPRHKRLARNPHPRPLALTPRDLAILLAVHEYRLLSQTQIHRLLFTHNHPSIPQDRLRRLFDHGYLQRRTLPRVGGVATSPLLYLLDELGVDYLQSEGHEDIFYHPDTATLGFNHVEHLLDINTFRVEVALASQTSPSYHLTQWTDDLALGRNPVRLLPQGYRSKVALIPDGHFALDSTRLRQHFFLELDRATMPIKRFRQKILTYFALANSGLAQKHFGAEKFRVLTVTLSAERGQHLQAATEQLGGGNRFWFGVLSDLTSATVLHQPVWHVAGRTDPTNLLD